MALLLWLAAITIAHAGDTMEQEINQLLNAVASSDCIFEEFARRVISLAKAVTAMQNERDKTNEEPVPY